MPKLIAGARQFSADLILFDKDGTLIDFHAVWAGRAIRAVAATAPMLNDVHRDSLLLSLGVDAERQRVDGSGVLAQLAHDEIAAYCQAHLLDLGVDRQAARRAVEERFSAVMRATPTVAEMSAIGDVGACLNRLREAGLLVGVVTTDDREATELTLDALDISKHVFAIACGDDPRPPKPAPDGILAIADEAGVDPAACLMIGDTLTDMRAARAAGCGCIGVTSGGATAAVLAEMADAVIDNIHQITPAMSRSQ